MKTSTKLWIVLAILAVLTPLGLLLPEHFGAGSAWGEWSTDELKQRVGYAPKGLTRLSDKWHAPIPDYAHKNHETSGLRQKSVDYIASAAIGIIVIAGITVLVGKVLTRHDGSSTS